MVPDVLPAIQFPDRGAPQNRKSSIENRKLYLGFSLVFIIGDKAFENAIFLIKNDDFGPVLTCFFDFNIAWEDQFVYNNIQWV